ncbi:DUF4907 domain-containing protein [Salinimicrobium sp. TIG7-5_MAKvit]|uniref:DUF4907 domain-containing protein n=1 Tax=Salinimicrobium sp. TIG7-5_MAKvit TaxID=3121289 RepID=UPI003C6E47A7
MGIYKAKRIMIPLVCLILSITGTVGWSGNDVQKGFNTEVYQVESGYGYLIAKNDLVLIRQEFIPAVSQKQPFSTSEEAEKVAQRVVSKLEKKENPGISVNELEEMAINYKSKFSLPAAR